MSEANDDKKTSSSIGKRNRRRGQNYERKIVKELKEITFESIQSVHKVSNSVSKIKLIGAGAKELASKIKDDKVITSGNK